jgi:hypothetical protein
MSDDGRTLPPPGQRPAAPPRRATLGGVGDRVSLDVPETEQLLRAEQERSAQLLRDLKQAELAKAELERQARVRAETDSPASFPPPVLGKSPQTKVTTSSTPPSLETAQIEGALVWLTKRAVQNRKAIFGIIAALGVGGGGVAMKAANEKPQPPPVTAEQLTAAMKPISDSIKANTKATNDLIRLVKCLRRQQNDLGSSLLPAKDHMGSARKPQPWEDECGENPQIILE